jgi:hypothetical protein
MAADLTSLDHQTSGTRAVCFAVAAERLPLVVPFGVNPQGTGVLFVIPATAKVRARNEVKRERMMSDETQRLVWHHLW